MSGEISKQWEGKRVLIIWTDEAAYNGNEWVSFHVAAEVKDGLLLQGVKSPNGQEHDGGHTFTPWDEIRDIIEWKFKV